MLAIEVAPYRRYLRPPVRHEGSEAREGALLEKICIIFRNDLRHAVS
jgi:hypothetical protein